MNRYILINSLAFGGAERVAINLYNFLNFSKIFLLEKDVKYQLNNQQIEFLSDHHIKFSPILKSLFIPIYAWRLAKKIRSDSIIVSMLERANYVNILASLLSKHKTIISVHMSQSVGRSKLHPYNLLTRILYPKADIIISVSEGIKSELEKFYKIQPQKIKVIYNPIDFKDIQEKMQEELKEYEDIFCNPVLINIGRLTRQKGQWFLLRIYKALKDDFPMLKLVILGDGELRNYLFKISTELGLKTFMWDKDDLSSDFDVYFLGFQKNPFKFIAKSALFVLPSLWEGFPMVLLESLACGVPIISSDCQSGPREILAPNTNLLKKIQKPEFGEYGILMPAFENKFQNAEDPLTEKEKIWVETLKEFLKNESLRKEYSKKAKERAVDFSAEKIIDQWKKLLG
ncbi:MAG: glycosyltransferase [Minisyncoccia bacterium]